jgi:hypothetical protein
VDSKEELKVETPPSPPASRRSGRLPIPRLRRGETPPLTGLSALLKEVRSYNPKGDARLLEQAFNVAQEAH